MNPVFTLAISATLIGLVLVCSAPRSLGQQTAASKTGEPVSPGAAGGLSQAQINEIIRKFALKETQFRQALNSYAFKRDALVQILGMGGQVAGEYHRVSDFTFDNQGNRFERINFFPMPSMPAGTITPEDLEDLGGVNPFALEARKLDQYSFTYIGKERIDELDLYVFDVAPKVMPKKSAERMYVGRIWVDDHDLQIVKSKGKGVPETKDNKFPIVETYREQIDGKYWFPTYSYADDDLVFENGQDLRIRMRVKYSDYVVGRGKVTITEIGEATPESINNQSQTGAMAPRPSGPVEGGMLNSKAIDLPPPIYPEEAKKVHASGQVQVKVLVDETGKVMTADVVFGPKSLWLAAIDAAKKARFKPIVIEGTAVKVTGILTYDFVEP